MEKKLRLMISQYKIDFGGVVNKTVLEWLNL